MNREKIEPQIEEGWKKVLEDEFQKDYFYQLKDFLKSEYKSHKVYPKKTQLLRAFNETPFRKVKVVVIGQDPYHGPNQANGLSFSVNKGIPFPPSLKNILKELESDLSVPYPTHGDLTSWAKQGVLMLNTCLSVRAHSPLSHQNKGWENFTDAAIKAISENREKIVFLIWGKKAEKKLALINQEKHQIFIAPHPSPFSARYGFFGCKHFSKTNDFLRTIHQEPIDWKII